MLPVAYLKLLRMQLGQLLRSKLVQVTIRNKTVRVLQKIISKMKKAEQMVEDNEEQIKTLKEKEYIFSGICMEKSKQIKKMLAVQKNLEDKNMKFKSWRQK